MRTIKFRAWNGRERKMTTPALWINELNLPCSQLGSAPTDPLMQFTGLKDKNGVDIYENDITVNEKGRVCQIIWFEPAACWDAKFIEDRTPKFNGMKNEGYRHNQWSEYIEVIGNIHANPELLDAKL